ncbi:MAG: DNA sulfur modification protein DndD [Arenicella sp.]|jgi:DNA sulfur modification protein DndD
MRIENIKLNNFRIYEGSNQVSFSNKQGKNVSLIAGKNGFGKTTFLTSLIWGLYGNLMSQVEDKYKGDIKSAGGYDNFLKTLLNKNVLHAFESEEKNNAKFEVQIELIDVMIPSIPCKKVVIKRSYDHKSKKESLSIFIDGQENELTKEVGYEVFINDFILPREIAKFFFFDAEKIVTLAEAKSKSELRSLSKAYSEVLGIKKYEDLKLNLNTLLTKLRRSGVSKVNKERLDELIEQDRQLTGLIEKNELDQQTIDDDITVFKTRLDAIQEKLIREGNAMTLEELKELKDQREALKMDHEASKGELKKLLDIVPLVIAGPRLKELVDQIKKEMKLKNASLNKEALAQEFNVFGKEFSLGVSDLVKDKTVAVQMSKYFNQLAKARLDQLSEDHSDEILLDFDDETARSIIGTYNYIQDSFKTQFEAIVKREKNARQHLGRVKKKIKGGEARKDNPLAQHLRKDKLELDEKVDTLFGKKQSLTEDLGGLKTQQSSNHKVLSEYEKNFNLVETDKKKYDVTLELLEKLNVLTVRIKEEKKYSLQKSILLGLNKLMHKDDFVSNVQVRIEEDVMDIDLLDKHGNVIDKDTLSKGEQQLYATALLKALVDESGIDFPVFIDSPLQKFDKEHSSNVIQQFYPSISEQVVLFPLLEKELSKMEYDQLKPNLNGVYLIDNSVEGSTIEECEINQLFTKFNEQHVLAY